MPSVPSSATVSAEGVFALGATASAQGRKALPLGEGFNGGEGLLRLWDPHPCPLPQGEGVGTAGISLRQHGLFDRLEGGAQYLIDHLHRHEGHGLPHVVGEFIEVTLIALG